MADDINFRLNTEGNTEGAEAVEKSIFAAEDAAKSASRQADVDAVKAKQAVEVQRQQAESLREIADAQQRIILAGLADVLGKHTQQWKGMSPEIDLVIDGSKNFLNTLASTGDPVKASLALIGTAIGGVVTAYQEAEKVAAGIAKREKEDLKNIAELRAQYAQQLRTENLSAFFRRETDELDEQEKVLERIVRLRASERELAAIEQRAAGAAAVDSGGSPAAAAAANLQVQTANQVQSLLDDLAKVNADVENARTLALDLKLKAQALNQPGNDAAAAIEASKAADEAQKALLELQADQPTRTVEIINQIQGVLTESDTLFRDLAASGLKGLTEVAARERDALQAEVDRLGANASSGAKSALAVLEKILADGQIRADEVAKFNEAQGLLNRQQELSNAAVLAAFEEGRKLSEAYGTELLGVKRQLELMGASFRQQFDALRQQSSSNQSGY